MYKMERGRLKIVKKAAERKRESGADAFTKVIEIGVGCVNKRMSFVDGKCIAVQETLSIW